MASAMALAMVMETPTTTTMTTTASAIPHKYDTKHNFEFRLWIWIKKKKKTQQRKNEIGRMWVWMGVGFMQKSTFHHSLYPHGATYSTYEIFSAQFVASTFSFFQLFICLLFNSWRKKNFRFYLTHIFFWLRLFFLRVCVCVCVPFQKDHYVCLLYSFHISAFHHIYHQTCTHQTSCHTRYHITPNNITFIWYVFK